VRLVAGGHLVDEGAGLREAGHDSVLHLDALVVRGDGDDIFDREGATIEDYGHVSSLEARPVGVNGQQPQGLTRHVGAERSMPQIQR
jgi:hypothetical protein